MKKIMLIMAVALSLGLTGCSILPETSPIILEGEPIESEESTKETKESNQPSSEEESTEEESTEEESTEESTEEEIEEEWVELPKGGEAEPIVVREIKVKEKEDEEDDRPDEERLIMQSFLTGEWKDYDVVKRRNIAVMYPNGS